MASNAVLFFHLAVLSYSARSIDNAGFFFETMEDTRDQPAMGVGHLEPDTSSDDFAEDVCRNSAPAEDVATASHVLADF